MGRASQKKDDGVREWSRSIILWIAIVTAAVCVFLALCVFYAGRSGLGRREPGDVVAEVAPAETVAIFNFRPDGDADAKYYAIGFARALADRLYCAPTTLTQQPSLSELAEQLCLRDRDPREPVSDKLALDISKSLGVRYVITGDFRQNGNQVHISVSLSDMSVDASQPPITASGTLSNLHGMQVGLAKRIAEAMKLDFNPALLKSSGDFNFRHPKTLLLYGRSFLADDFKETERYRWQAVEMDPHSSFPAIRLLEFYVYGPATCREIQAERRLPGLVETAARRFPNNSHLAMLRGLLLAKQYEYRKAEAVLKALVKADPKMVAAHSALAEVAKCRNDADLAVKEGKVLVSLWPTSARCHAFLSSAYNSAADNARRGRYYGKMLSAAKEAWQHNSEAGLREARIATRLDRNCASAWADILVIGRELGLDKDHDTAFRELIRINPKNLNAYEMYAFSFSPQWGGTAREQERVFSMAEEVFGEGSSEACLLRGWVGSANSDRAQHREENLALFNEAISKSKGQNNMALHLKCETLMGLRRRGEMLEVAKQGFELWPSPEWRMLLAKGYQFRWEDARDRAALDKAAELLSVYVAEIPFDPHGHNEYGWCLSHQGKRKEARREFLTALELDPGNRVATEKLKFVR